MNILYIVPYVPSRIRVRPYQLLHSLLRRGHHVTLATLWESDEERDSMLDWRAKGLRTVAYPLTRGRAWRNLTWALTQSVPLQARYSWQPDLVAALEAELLSVPYDVVHVEHLRGSEYGLRVQDLRRRLPAAQTYSIIWDSVDCITYLFEQAAQQSRNVMGRLMSRVELTRTRRREGWLVHQFDATVVSSNIDHLALQRLAMDFVEPNNAGVKAVPCTCLDQKIKVIPNGVDLEYFSPGDSLEVPARLVFSGKMSYHANVTAAMYLVNEIAPLIWQDRPDVQIWIVGKNPAAAVTNLATIRRDWDAAMEMPERSVVVTGTVPDIRPYLQGATLAVAPVVYGAGTQNKVLEAMACGTAVVASSKATAALAVQPGRELLVADHPEGFATAVLGLLNNPSWRRQLSQAARVYVGQNHSWDAAAGRLEQVYAEAIVSASDTPECSQ